MFVSQIQGGSLKRQRISLALLILCASFFALIPAQAEAAGTSSDYIVLYDSGAGLSQKVASEEARGNERRATATLPWRWSWSCWPRS